MSLLVAWQPHSDDSRESLQLVVFTLFVQIKQTRYGMIISEALEGLVGGFCYHWTEVVGLV